MSATQKHIVVFPYQAWGHTRPLVHLTARLVKLRLDVHVTFILTDAYYDRTVAEYERTDMGEYARHIRVVSAGASSTWDFGCLDSRFNGLLAQLVTEEAVVCRKTGTRFEPLPKPDAVIIEFMAAKPIHAIRELSGNSIKIYAWVSASTYVLFHPFGPTQCGGRGSLIKKIEDEAHRTGRPIEEVAAEEAFLPKGEIVDVPALPLMYDYEYHPQELAVPNVLGGTVFPYIYDALETCDGMFLGTPEPYERDAVAAVKKWYAESGRPAYLCGPLIPPKSATVIAREKEQSADSTQIQDFLDSILETAGEKSLLYITFGTVYWPTKTEKIWAFLDVVMELGIPFIMSHASPQAVVPEEVKEKVKAYGKCVLSKWSPQQMILEHPATGWFVTHGGHNSVTESIFAGVPLILWPFALDQPTNAVHICETLQVGYELIEVRTGHAGLHTIYRTGRTPKGTIEAVKEEARDVLTKAFGADGAEKRKRLIPLTHAVTHEWEEGGAALRDVKEFAESL
ncbi:UDP-Glycosyltransferase/glycogen phosphorylase [Lenzites betulinus]|nr:UDP-Glycosyltransferase/glycogen phosphorylase [Lenzites betulinus]